MIWLAYRTRKEPDKAVGVLKDALEQYPDSKAVHYAVARIMLEDGSDDFSKIEEHLVRSYDRGDRNFEARHVCAQFMFLVGRFNEAATLFEEVNSAAPEDFRLQTPRTPSVVSKRLPTHNGRVVRKHETFMFISISAYPADIYANEAGSDFKNWNEVFAEAEVEFEVRFNRIGPVAVDVRLRNR